MKLLSLRRNPRQGILLTLGGKPGDRSLIRMGVPVCLSPVITKCKPRRVWKEKGLLILESANGSPAAL